MSKVMPETTNLEFNKIVAGTHIKGEIETNGDIRIDGTVLGTLKCKGKIVLGSTGKIEGEISCKNAEIQGIIKAHIQVDELLSLKNTAQVEGDILTNKIAIEPGAKISGSINMDKKVNPAPNPVKPAVPNAEIRKEPVS